MEMVPANSDKERFLYRCERFEPEDNQLYVEWMWLSPEELKDFSRDSNIENVRRATYEEENLYEEAYADGYGVAAMLEFESQYDGITFRVELGEDGNLDFNGKKMFQCAICDSHKDFETEVATVGDFYIGMVKDDKLWHICYDCALIGVEINEIEIENDTEGTS